MKHKGLILVLALVTVGAGCSSGGDVSVAQITQAQLEQCVRSGVLDMLRLGARLQDIVDAIRGDLDAAIVTIRTSAGDDPTPTYDVSANFPYGGTGPNDQMLAGTLNFSADPEDGIEVGDVIIANLNITSQGGPLTGFISVRITVASDSASEFDGTVDITDNATGCVISFSFDPNNPLFIDGLGFQGPQIAVNFLGIAMTGRVDFLLELGDRLLNASMDLLPNSQVVTVTGTEDGVPFTPVDIDLFPTEEEIDALIGCAQGLFLIAEVVDAITNAILEVGGIDIPNVTVTPTSATTYDFTSMDGGITVTGSLTLTSPTTADVTWNISVDGATGSSTAPWKFTVPGVSTPSASGDAVFNVTAVAGCTLTMSIPESAPLRLASDGPTSGKIMLKVEIDPDTLEIDLDLMETEFDSIIAIRINGLPVPPFLLFGE